MDTELDNFRKNLYNLTRYHVEPSDPSEYTKTIEEYNKQYDDFMLEKEKPEHKFLHERLLKKEINIKRFAKEKKTLLDKDPEYKDLKSNKLRYTIFIIKPYDVYEKTLEITCVEKLRSSDEVTAFGLVKMLYILSSPQSDESKKTDIINIVNKDDAINYYSYFYINYTDLLCDKVYYSSDKFIKFNSENLKSAPTVKKKQEMLRAEYEMISQSKMIAPGNRFFTLDYFHFDNSFFYGTDYNPVPFCFLQLESNIKKKKSDSCTFLELFVVGSKIHRAFLNVGFFNFFKTILFTIKRLDLYKDYSKLDYYEKLLVLIYEFLQSEKRTDSREEKEKQILELYRKNKEANINILDTLDKFIKMYIRKYFYFEQLAERQTFRKNNDIRLKLHNKLEKIIENDSQEKRNDYEHIEMKRNLTGAYTGRKLDRNLQWRNYFVNQSVGVLDRIKDIPLLNFESDKIIMEASRETFFFYQSPYYKDTIVFINKLPALQLVDHFLEIYDPKLKSLRIGYSFIR